MNKLGRSMDGYESQARLFKTLMHPARLAILEILRPGEACVCHMEAALGYRQAYISQQLMVLREAGLVGDRRDGWNIYYRVAKPEIFKVMDSARAALGRTRKTGERFVAKLCNCPNCTHEVARESRLIQT
jgi:ArsR family transcriptional regulator